MALANSRRAATTVVLIAGLLQGGCAFPPPPLTDEEKAAITETMTRVATDLLVRRDRAGCEAAIDRNFSSQEPVLTWSVAGDGAPGVYTFLTNEELRTSCVDTAVPSHFELERADAYVLSRDHAYLVLSGSLTDGPGDDPSQGGYFISTNIFERIGEDWKIVRHHGSLIGNQVAAGH